MPARAALSEAHDFLEKHPDVTGIELLIPDINGVLRGKQIGRDGLLKVYSEGVCLPGSLFGTDITGETVEETGLGFDVGDTDQLCWPLAGTLCLIPWLEHPMAQLVMSMRQQDGKPFFADPQQVLSQVLEHLNDLQLYPQVALELEFYLIDQARCKDGSPQPPRSPLTGEREHTTQVYGLNELNDFRELFEEISSAAGIQNIPVEALVAEYAAGQYEINLRYQADVQLACTHAVLLKRLIKAIVLRHDMEATFMARPYSESSGSGTHAHISLLDDKGHNVFSGATGMGSDMLRHAIGGLFVSMEESMAIFAPNANSYRRFQDSSFVPMSHSWGWNNRTVAVRIPGGASRAQRLEHRIAGADTNPYLLVAVLLAGIHHGITRRVDPGPPVSGNAYEQCEPSLTTEWSKALELFARRKLLGDYLDADFCKVYLACKNAERAQFGRRVTPLEYQWYLRLT